MKVAMCFSGLPRGDYQKNIKQFRKVFPYDFFFSTWAGQELKEKHTVYQEPHSDYLKPFVKKNKFKKVEVLNRGYKQLVGHALQILFDVPKEYDMIVRCRYDIVLNEKYDWVGHLKESYEDRCVKGFRYSVKPRYWDGMEICYPKRLLLDQIIMHRREQYDPSHVLKLYYEEKLKPCEMGWFQSFETQPIKNYIGGIKFDETYK